MFGVGGPVRSRARAFLRSYVRYRPVPVTDRLDALRTLSERAAPDLTGSRNLTRHELKVFSQNGEDGVLVEIFNRIGVTNRYFVEFGIQDGTEGNCVFLADVLGWSGLFIEADLRDHERVARKYDGTDVTVLRELVTADRVDDIFAAADVPAEPDLVSIDVDGNDLYVWRALVRHRPRVVVIEYNAGIDAPGAVAQPHRPDRGWDGSAAFGSTVDALEVVATEKGYRLAHTDLTGTNAFFVREEDWAALEIDQVPRRPENYGLTGITRTPAEPEGGWQPIA